MTPSSRTPPPEAAASQSGRDDGAVILASWTLHAVLRRYPQLLDVLIERCPAFIRLRNPVLRKVQTRLVTVAQAARIGGIEPTALVHTLNAAIGASASVPPPDERLETASTATGTDVLGAPVAVELDVRPMLAGGEEPFHAVMTAVANVPGGQTLRLRVGFEPLPLYDVLSHRGFTHQAFELGPDDWEVLFLREVGRAGPAASSDSAPGVSPAAALSAVGESPGVTLRIDVSDLTPPEPMVRILEMLSQLPAGQTLLVEHVRRPVYLYPQLDALGYQHETSDLGPGRVELRIHKPLTTAGEVRQ